MIQSDSSTPTTPGSSSIQNGNLTYVTFPEDFPLQVDVYDPVQLDDDPSAPPPPAPANPNDPRRRDFASLYPLDWLTSSAQNAAAYPQAAIGRLRSKWQQAFQQDSKGEWNYVEYVPAWSDPDWDARYVYVEGADADDEMAKQYAKPGLLQRQRPALRPEDAGLNPTEGAKRWGVYPFRQWEGAVGWASASGWSGTTPRTAAFPPVPLSIPRPTPARGGLVQTDVTLADMERERLRYEQTCRQRRLSPSEEGFRQTLTAISQDASNLVNADMAGSVLVMYEAVTRRDEREEYQRLVFGGNTSVELRDKGAWTQDADASTDLATPLHDLVTRDKWARTEDRGTAEDEPRVVYNISGKQGEYSAIKYDDTLWIALQPALQLVSKVLDSQHPATWVGADIRKLRPVTGLRDLDRGERSDDIEDEHRRRGILRQWRVSVWPDAPVTDWELTGLAKQWAEFEGICASGFDSTPYVCGILRRTIEWRIRPLYRVAEGGGGLDGTYGLAEVLSRDDDDDDDDDARPFTITITLAADLMWPLLVDDYSPAEKASATIYVANTMLHEIAHAVVFARCQLFVPGSAAPGHLPVPPWLVLNPIWTSEIQVFDQQKGVDILRLLQTFGMRIRHDLDSMERSQLFWPLDEVYFQNEPTAEEGWATENQYWGGVFEPLPAAVCELLPHTDNFRFLNDMTTIAALGGWRTDSGSANRFDMKTALPRSSYLKLLSQEWWSSSFQIYGPSAIKLDQGGVVPGMVGLDIFSWRLVHQRYGPDVRSWLETVWDRVKEESDNQLLWRYLYAKTVVAVEPQGCGARWFQEQKDWDETDLAIWNENTEAMTLLEKLNAAIQIAVNQDTRTFERDPAPLLLHFRQFFGSIRHLVSALDREASYNQNVAARYIILEEGPAKEKLFRLYAERVRKRLTGLYLLMIRGLVGRLDAFINANDRIPTIKAWLCSNKDIAQMWNLDTLDTRSKLQAIARHLQLVCDIYSDDPGRRRVVVDQLGAVPSGAARNQAQRIERLAMRQYGLLGAADPLRRCAAEWMDILRNGDLLRNPDPGTAAAQVNRRLAARTAGIDAAVSAHDLAVRQSHPDTRAQRQIAGQALVNQPPPAGSSKPTRFATGDQQRVFAFSSGYQPYQDPTTGFTRFTDVRTQVRTLQPPGPVPGPPPPPPPHGAAADPTVFLHSLEQQIQTTGATLQKMQQQAQAGAPVNLTRAAPQIQNVFGVSAAQRGYAVQQLEDLVGQREAAQSFTAGQGQLRHLGWDSQSRGP